MPAVYGHEASGRVAEVGAGVTDLAVGNRVVVTLIRSCGMCRFCRRGLSVSCETRFGSDESGPIRDGSGREINQSMGTGAFAEQVVVHRSQVVAIDDDVPFDAAALLGCGVITGVGAVNNTAGVEPGSQVVVIGTGGVGLNAVQGAALAGARTVVAVDVSDFKLDAARSLGATHAVNAGSDVAAAVADATDGAMADYVFVTVGAKSAFDRSYSLLAPGGAVVVVGIPASGVMSEVDPGALADLNQRVLGSKMGSSRIAEDIPRLIELYRKGGLHLDELITNRYPLERINDAIASSKEGTALRNVIMFE